MKSHKVMSKIIFIKKYLIILCFFPICIFSFNSCITALIYAALSKPSDDVKGTLTTVDTLGGYSYEAILIYYNSLEKLLIARDEDGNYILYANITTFKDLRPGSLFILIDGERHTICNPNDWDLDRAKYNNDINRSDFGTLESREWSINKLISNTTITALLNAEIVVFRVINSYIYLGYEKGVDVSSILPKMKEFISE